MPVEDTQDEVFSERRVYELGYLAVTTLTDSERDNAIGGIRKVIEERGGTFISEGSADKIDLAYTMYTRDREKNVPHETAFFGWMKFEIAPAYAEELRTKILPLETAFIRTILFSTVAEDTRAHVALNTLKEVKKQDTIQGPRVEEKREEVSESELDKTVDSIVADIL
jgi:ribosomal protein S6